MYSVSDDRPDEPHITEEAFFPQGCSLSPILFSVFINGLLKEVEQAGLGVELSDGSTIGGMLFADDFVGVSNSEAYQCGACLLL